MAHKPIPPERGLLDTNILILRRQLPAGLLRGDLAISAVTLAELSAGVHMVRIDHPEVLTERANRMAVLQLVENEFDPIPFGQQAARMFGRMSAAMQASGRTPRRRLADLMIAATAAAESIPLYTTNPDDFEGLEGLVAIIPVPRPSAQTTPRP